MSKEQWVEEADGGSRLCLLQNVTSAQRELALFTGGERLSRGARPGRSPSGSGQAAVGTVAWPSTGHSLQGLSHSLTGKDEGGGHASAGCFSVSMVKKKKKKNEEAVVQISGSCGALGWAVVLDCDKAQEGGL